MKEKALALAMSDAQQMAGRLAAGFGVKVGKVLSIQMSGGGGFGRMTYSVSAPAYGGSSFQPGQIKIKNSVQVVFELKDSIKHR